MSDTTKIGNCPHCGATRPSGRIHYCTTTGRINANVTGCTCSGYARPGSFDSSRCPVHSRAASMEANDD